MNLKDCLKKISKKDATAIQQLVDSGMSETEAVLQQIGVVDGEIEKIAQTVSDSGGQVVEATPAPGHLTWTGLKGPTVREPTFEELGPFGMQAGGGEEIGQTPIPETTLDMGDFTRQAGGGEEITWSQTDPRILYQTESTALEEDRRWSRWEPEFTGTDKYLGSPEWVNEGEDRASRRKNLVRMRKALRKYLDEGLVGRYWYEESARAVQQITDNVVEAEKLIQLLAIYSPQASVQTNTNFAVRAWNQWKNGVKPEDFKVKTSSQDEKAVDVLYNNKPFDGRKTNSFYLNLMHDLVARDPTALDQLQLDDDLVEALNKPATIDLWMYRAFGYANEQAGDDKGSGKYSFAENEVRRISAELNRKLSPGEPRWTPHQVQAAIWSAMKARYEIPEVKEKTWKESIRKGYAFIGEDNKRHIPTDPEKLRKHRAIWRKHAVAITSDEARKTAETTSASFSDFIDQMVETVTWEAIPSASLGHDIFTASPQVKAMFTQEVKDLLIGKEGTDLLAEKLGVPISWINPGAGGYEGNVNPNNLSHILPTKGESNFSRAEVQAYARAIQYITKQDAVPWFRADPRAMLSKSAQDAQKFRVINTRDGRTVHKSKVDTLAEAQAIADRKGEGFEVRGGKYATGVVLRFDHNLTSTELSDILDLLGQAGIGGFTRTAPNEISMVNFRDDDTGVPFVADEDFFKSIDQVKAGLSSSGMTEANHFWSEGEYGYEHNWKDDPEGNAILDKGGISGRPDLQAWVRGRRKAFEQVLEGYSGEKLALREQEAGVKESSGDTLWQGGGRQAAVSRDERVSTPPVRDDGTVELTHWGQVGELRELDPAFYGKGITGQERMRKRGDPKNWLDRTYFGIAVDQLGGYEKERGLGRHRYTVGLPRERLYDWHADPDGFYAKAQDLPGDKLSVRERLVHEAGYAGYWVNDPHLGLTAAVFEKTEPESYIDETPVLMQSSGDVMASWIRGMGLMDASKDKLFKTEVAAPVVVQKFGIADKISMTKAVRSKILEKHFENKDDPINPLIMKHLPVLIQDPRMVFRTMDGFGNISEAVLLKAGTNNQNPVVAIFRDGKFRTIMQYSGGMGITPSEQLRNAIDEVMYTEDRGTLDAVLPGYQGRVTTKSDLIDEFGEVYKQSTEWYYSALERNLESIPQERNSVQGWKQIIQKNLPQKGVQKGEIEYSGVIEWLDEQKGKVSKQDLLDYIRTQDISIEETQLGGGDWVVVNHETEEVRYFADLDQAEAFRNDEIANLRYDMEEMEMEVLTGPRAGEIDTVIQDPVEVIAAEDFDPDQAETKYTTYQMEGEKEGYTELLLTLPTPDWYYAGRRDMPSAAAAQEMYTSPHWDQPNVVVHVRFNTREVDGKRTLVIEEVQSDWAQEGRKKGYFRNLGPELEKAIDAGDDVRVKEIRDQIESMEKSVPDQPFKDTSTWAMLGMKRMIRYAAENGYEQIAWAPGEVQAERYDLSKQIDAIRWIRFKEGKYRIHVMKGGEEILTKTGSPDEIEGVIGKEVTQKITDSAGVIEGTQEVMLHGEGNVGLLKGLDLKVGGEGMKGFYDKILPKAVNKFTKKWGAKVGVGAVDNQANKFFVYAGQQELIGPYDTREIAEQALRSNYGTQTGSTVATRAEAKGRRIGQEVWTLPITDPMRDAALSGLPLWQPKAEGQRGWYDPSQRVIGLTKASDVSTFLHESGHLFLNMERMFAERYGLTSDHKAMLKWMGVESFNDIGVEQHEKFAETFEVYLRTGKAPSLQLRRIFASFARWLSQIYKTLKDPRIARAELTEEITGIFDRILATEEEIEAAKGNPLYDQFFRSQAQAGMTDAQWKRYTDQVEKVEGTARATVQEKVIKEWRQRYTRDWKEKKAPMIVDEKARLKKTPVYAILEDAKTNKLDRGALIEINGSFPTKFTGKAVLEGGVHPDHYADVYGYRTTKQMIDAIQASQPLNKAAEQAAEARMIETYGDILNDGTIEREIDEYMHNDERDKLLLMELQQLRKQTGKPKINRDYLKAEAARIVGGMTYAELKPGKFYRSEVRAAKKTVSAKTEEEALEAKAQELANHYLYKEVIEARRKMDSARKFIRSVQTREYPGKKYDPDYSGMMRKIANLYYAKTRDQQLEDIKSILEWYKGQIRNEDPDEPAIWESLALIDLSLAEAHLAQKEKRLDSSHKLKELKSMTVDEVLSVREMLEQLRYIAIQLGNAEQEKKKAERKVLSDSIIENGGKSINRFPGQRTKTEKFFDSKVWVFVNSIPSLRNLLRKLDDNYEGEGFAQKMIYRPIEDAIDVRQKMRMDMYKQFQGEMAQIRTLGLDGTRGSRKMYTLESGEPYPVSPEARFMIGVYWGIESSREAIRQGFGFTDADVMMILSDMTQEQLEFLNVVWKMNESLWPALRDATIKRLGVAPPKLDPAPFTVNGVNLTGGHMRLFYDDARIQMKSEAEIASNGSPQQIVAGLSGSAITRVGSGGKAPDLDKNNIIRSMEENIHYIAMSDASMEISSIINSPVVKEAIVKKHGEGFYRALVNNVQSITSGRADRESDGTLAALSRWTRRSLTFKHLMFSVRNTVQQLSALIPAAAEIGTLDLASALVRFHTPGKHADIVKMIDGKTAFMEDRGALVNREASNYLRGKLSAGKVDHFAQVVSQWGFAPQTFMDARLAYPVWLVRYEESINKGLSEEESVSLANTAVAETVGSGADLHLGKLFHSTNNEFIKLFTMFGSWFNAYYQRLYRSSKGGTSFGNARFIGNATIGPMLTAMISALLIMDAPGEDADEEEWLKWFFQQYAKFMGGTYPIARDIAGAFEGFTPTTPLGSGIGTSVRAVKSLDEILEDPAKVANKMADLATTVMPIPGGGTVIRVWDCLLEDEECGIYQALVEGPDRNK